MLIEPGISYIVVQFAKNRSMNNIPHARENSLVTLQMGFNLQALAIIFWIVLKYLEVFFKAYQATALNTILFNNDSPALLFISCIIFIFNGSKTETHSLPSTPTWSIPLDT